MEEILDRNRAIDRASLIGLGVNAPKELLGVEARMWAEVGRPDVPIEGVLEEAQGMIDGLAYVERVNRRMKRKVIH